MKETKRKFIKIISLICIACISTTAIIGFIFSKKQIETRSINNYQQIAATNAEKISAWMGEKGAIVESVSRTLVIKNDFDIDLLRNYLTEMKKAFDDEVFCDLYFTYPDNKMACTNGFVTDGTIQFVQRPWYKKAVLSGEVHYESPYLDLDTKNYIVTVSKAIVVDGKLKGVLAADLYANQITSVMDSISLPKNSYAMLIDSNLGIVTHPNEKYLYRNGKYTKLDMFENQVYLPLMQLVKKPGDNYTWNLDYDNNKRIFFKAKVNSGDYYVIIGIDEKQWNREYYDLIRFYIGAMSLLSLIIGIINVNVFTKELIKPVHKAEVASKAKSQFLSSMSHEIRTPINAILGMNELILRESTSENITEYAENISTAGKTLLGLISDILDMSKIEAGKMAIENHPYSVEEIIEDIKNTHSTVAKAKGLSFFVNVDKRLPSSLYGDDLRIKEIFNNVISNAIKYTKEGSVTVNVGCEIISSETIKFFCSVTDTGIGIKEQDIAKITKAFERVDIAKNRYVEGTGLGMSIVSNLLALMDGKLEIKSKYGEGTEVYFSVLQKVIDATPIKVNKTGNKALFKPRYKNTIKAPGLNVLVVDDKEINCKILKKLLEPTEIKVDVALSGEEALEKCKEKKYHMIFMDHMMPGMDGIETLNCILENKELYRDNGSSTVIAITANAVKGAKEEYLEKGFSDYLSKPVDTRMLERIIIKHMPEDALEVIEEEQQ